MNAVRSKQEVISHLLDSLAVEELAIARLIEAQAEKIQAFTGRDGSFPTRPTNKQINEFQSYVARILEALNAKQKNLIQMVELSRELLEEQGEWAEDD